MRWASVKATKGRVTYLFVFDYLISVWEFLPMLARDLATDLHFGISVGVDRYPNVSGAGDLRFARRDAKSFHQWLVAPDGGGLPAENTELLKQRRDGEQPSQAEVVKTLARWHDAVRELKPGSAEWERTRLYVYGAGHGYGPSDGTAALLLADATDQGLGFHLEIQNYLHWLTTNAPFREVILFTDCCRRRYEKGAPSYRPPFSLTSPDPPVEVFSLAGYAARRNEVALEPVDPVDPEEARGIFTRALLDGLRGSAANDGVVTSGSLASYVRSSVEGLTRNSKTPQKVEFPADLSQRINICFPQGSAPLRTVTLRFPSSAYGEAVIRNGSFEIIERETTVSGTWTAQLEDGFYLLDFGERSGGFKPQKFQLVGEDIDVDA